MKMSPRRWLRGEDLTSEPDLLPEVTLQVFAIRARAGHGHCYTPLRMVNPEQPELTSVLVALVEFGRELRSLEYKQSMAWQDQATKLLVARSALAMSNIEDGGSIVFGVREARPGVFEDVGMADDHFNNFSPDDVSDYVNRFADPPIQLHVAKGRIDDRLFTIIRVSPFREVPTVCKRNGGPNAELREGAVYTRPYGVRPQSSEVRGQTEMREIIDRAVDKAVGRLRARLPEAFERHPIRSELDQELGNLL